MKNTLNSKYKDHTKRINNTDKRNPALRNREIQSLSLGQLLALVGMLLLLVFMGVVCINPLSHRMHFNQGDWQGDKLIGDGFGLVGDYKQTNSKEAFEAAYQRGLRTFEVYIQKTSDDALVLRKIWRDLGDMQPGVDQDHIPTREDYLAVPLYGEYTPLSFQDLLQLMTDYPDIWIVTRTAEKKPEKVTREFQLLIDEVVSFGDEKLLDRMIISLFNPEMYEAVEQVHSFKHYLFYLVGLWDGSDIEDFMEYCSLAQSKSIEGVVLNSSIYDPSYVEIARGYDLDLYLHSIENQGVAQMHLDEGVRGCYVDQVAMNKVYYEFQDGPVRLFPY